MDCEKEIVISLIVIAIISILYVLLTNNSTVILFERDTEIEHGQSAFFPLHFIITTLTMAIFSGLLYMIYKIQQSNDEALDLQVYLKDSVKAAVIKEYASQKIVEKMEKKLKAVEKNVALPLIGLDAGAAAGIGALVISLVVAFLANFVQVPILDYTVVIPERGDNHYSIKISNYGNAPAKHVLIYLAQRGRVFGNFTSEPFLSKHFTPESSTNSNEKAFAEIEVLPAFFYD
jgi:hypothetical protein